MIKNKIDDGSSEMINFKVQYFEPDRVKRSSEIRLQHRKILFGTIRPYVEFLRWTSDNRPGPFTDSSTSVLNIFILRCLLTIIREYLICPVMAMCTYCRSPQLLSFG